MAQEQNGHESNGKSRLDRLEGLMELLITDHLAFSDEHKKLLTAQIVLTDRMDQLARAQAHTDERLNALVEAQAHTDERLNALIAIIDDLIRKRPHDAP